MSRVFAGANYTVNEYIASVNSPSMGKLTFAGWVYVTAYGASGGAVFVKDPGSYLTTLEILQDGTLYALAGAKYLGGMATGVITTPGTGYVVGDEGVFTGGNPDIAGNRAGYHVTSLAGSGILTFTFTDNGQGYAVGQTYPTSRTSGVGSGFTFTVASIVNQAPALSQSIEAVPLNTWTHIAMTWDAAGDGLVHLYINGVETTYQGQRTASINDDTSTGPWTLGGDTFSFVCDGMRLAEAAIYDTALSSVQIAVLAASTSGATGSPIDYFHLCGFDSPEPNTANPTNSGTLSSPAPTAGGNSPGYSGCSGPPTPTGPGNQVIDSLSRCCSRVLP